jgi:excisionase family DNA binding protein
MDDESAFYTAQQAAQILGTNTQKVQDLIREGKLEAYRDEGTGHWRINARSVHALGELPPEPPEARGERVRTQGGKRADAWILLIIAVITLLAAGYTLIRAIGGY